MTARSTSIARHVVAAVVSAAFALPIVVMVTGSLRQPGSPPPRTPDLVPSDPSLVSYSRAFELVDLALQLRNSIVVSTLATAIAVVSASMAGFGIVRSSRRVATVLIGLAIMGLVVPPMSLVVGRFALYKGLGVLDTFVPLVAPALYGVSSLGVLMFAWSFSRLPAAVFETLDVEGVGPLAAWWRVALPLSRPVAVAVGLLAFVTTWNDLLSPLAFITSADLLTLPMGLRSLQLLGRQDTPVLLAGCVVATVPVLVAFAATQRHLFAPPGRT